MKKKIIIIAGVIFAAIIIGGYFALSLSNKNKEQKEDIFASVWDLESGSSKGYTRAEYEKFELDREKERENSLQLYNDAVKGTVAAQLNDTYIPGYSDESSLFQLKDGKIEVRGKIKGDEDNGEVTLWWAGLEKDIKDYVVADFNNDGLDDVVSVVYYSGGGSGFFYHLMIFENDRGKLKYLTDEYLGDRIVIKSVRYESGLFVVDIITQGEGENFMGYCCPNTPATLKFKLEDNALIELK